MSNSQQKNNHELEYKETFTSKWGYRLLRITLVPLIKAIFIKSVSGKQRIPKTGPVIIASNHESYLDFLCFSSIAGRPVHYLAAEVFFQKPLWRLLMKMTGQIRVDRDNPNKAEVHSQALSVLKQGRAFGIFPEGTRSRSGKLQKSFTGIAKFAVKSRAPILPVGIINAYEVWPPGQHQPKLAKRIGIKIGEPIYLDQYNELDTTEEDYRRITDYVMVKIAELIGQEYPFADKNTLSELH